MRQLLVLIGMVLCTANIQAQLATKYSPKQELNHELEMAHLDIDVPTATRLIANLNMVIIDVRTPEEIAIGKMDNALEMDIKSPTFKENLSKLEKNKPYLVYDYTGGRSDAAMKMMKEMGFKRVYNLKGGWKAWAAQNPTTK